MTSPPRGLSTDPLPRPPFLVHVVIELLLGKVANKGQSAENKDKIVLLRFTYLYVSKKAGVENEVGIP